MAPSNDEHSQGRHGITHVHGPVSHFSSVVACSKLDNWDPRVAQDFHDVLSCVRQLSRQPKLSAPACSQRTLSGVIDELQFEDLLKDSSEVHCARLRSCSTGGVASAWLPLSTVSEPNGLARLPSKHMQGKLLSLAAT